MRKQFSERLYEMYRLVFLFPTLPGVFWSFQGCNDPNPVAMPHGSAATTHFRSVAEQKKHCNGPWQPGTGVVSACIDENPARHAPLQRNNETGLFCNRTEWISHACCLHGDGPLSGACVVLVPAYQEVFMIVPYSFCLFRPLAKRVIIMSINLVYFYRGLPGNIRIFY